MIYLEGGEPGDPPPPPLPTGHVPPPENFQTIIILFVNVVSAVINFKNFLGGNMPPDPPSLSILPLATIFLPADEESCIKP